MHKLSHVRQEAGWHKASHKLSGTLNWSFVFIKVPENQSHMKSWPLTTAPPTYWREGLDAHSCQPIRLSFYAPCFHSGRPLCYSWRWETSLSGRPCLLWSFYPKKPPNMDLPGLSTKLKFSQWMCTEWMHISLGKKNSRFHTHSKTALNTDPEEKPYNWCKKMFLVYTAVF